VKILIHSNAPWEATGYGKQTRLLIPRLLGDGHEVVVSCVSGLNGGEIYWPVDGTSDDGHYEFEHRKTIRILPRGQYDFGPDTLPAYIEDERPDLVLLIMDCRMLGSIAEHLSTVQLQQDGPYIAAWVPSDTNPLSRPELAFLTVSGVRPIAMSRFAEGLLNDEDLSPAYIPHMVDTSVFCPRGEVLAAREEDRESLGIPADAFVVGMVAANNDAIRKGFPEQFEAFRRFRKSNQRAHLVVHTVAKSGRGHDLESLALDLDLGGAVSFTPALPQVVGRFDDAWMARLYRSFDVLSACSYAEGFGVPILETQACGTPVVVTDFGAMAEVGRYGFRVASQPFWNPVHKAWWGRPDVGEIVRGLNFFAKGGSSAGHRENYLDFARGFDADLIFQTCWRPFLSEVEASR
jgi:glycosyltransferase involved in cell wall biosynthesis